MWKPIWKGQKHEGTRMWNSRKENKNKMFREKRFGISSKKKKNKIKDINSNTNIFMKQENENNANTKNDKVC